MYCNGANQSTCSNDCSSSVTPLSSTSVNIVDNALWYTGTTDNAETLPLVDMYRGERGTQRGKICTSGDFCNDSVERTTEWVGKIGLIYPSDYVYESINEGCANDRRRREYSTIQIKCLIQDNN